MFFFGAENFLSSVTPNQGTHFNEMSNLWNFLGVNKVDGSLGEKIECERASNPDEEWQAERHQGIVSFLPKGQAGNGSRLFTEKDKSTFEVANGMLVKWKFEKDLNWQLGVDNKI